jgi:hypothetical protein
MKAILIGISLALLAGCASNPVPIGMYPSIKSPNTYGYKDYDPCIRCGEGWIFLNLDETQHLRK